MPYGPSASGGLNPHAPTLQPSRGAVHFSRTALERIRARLPAEPRLALARPISEGQAEFLRLLISPEAPTYERIAELMGTSVNMVYKHRNKLCARFGLKGKSALVRFGVRYFAGRPAG